MSFSELVSDIDSLLLGEFGPVQTDDLGVKSSQLITFRFKGGDSTDASVPFIVKNPALEEDYVPAQSSAGTSVLIIFVRLADFTSADAFTAPTPTKGDKAVITNGDTSINYDVFDSRADSEFGLSLKLRRCA